MQGKIAKSNNFLLVVNTIFSTKIEIMKISRSNGTRLDRDALVPRDETLPTGVHFNPI